MPHILFISYIEAYLVTEKEVYGQVAREIANFLVNVLQDPESGGFFSAQDGGWVDPETGIMKEGAYHMFTFQEVMDALGPELGKSYCSLYGIKQGGNIESSGGAEASGWPGQNVLMIRRDLDRLKPWDRAAMEQGKVKLAEIQAQRPKPVVVSESTHIEGLSRIKARSVKLCSIPAPLKCHHDALTNDRALGFDDCAGHRSGSGVGGPGDR